MTAYHTKKDLISFWNALMLALGIVLSSIAINAMLKTGELLTAINDVTIILVDLLAALGLLFAAQRSANYGNLRLAWTVLFLGLLTHTLGDMIWTITEIGLHQTPFPSLADACYLAQYPIFAMGILLLPKVSLTSSEKLKVSLDMGIVMIATVTVFWILLIAPIIESNEGADAYALALSVAYPVMDLLLLLALIELLFRKIKSISLGPMLLSMVGVAVMICTDLLFYGQSLQFGQLSQNSYLSGGMLDTGWIIAYLLLGLAGVLHANSFDYKSSSQADGPGNLQFTWPHYLPYIGAGAAYILLILSHDHSLPAKFSYMSWGVGCIIGLIIIRQIASLKENEILYKKSRLAEDEARKLNEELESRVVERTTQLASINEDLQREIQDRELAEEELLKSKEYLDEIINCIGDPIFVKDGEHRLVLANNAESALAGRPPEELLGKTDYDFFPKEQVEVFWKQDCLVLETGEENVNEEMITDARGNVRTIITV
jgi:PAS domain-containing protein